MRFSSLLIPLLLISICFSAEPGVITFQNNSLVRVNYDFTLIPGGVIASAGVMVIGSATDFLITIHPLNGNIEKTTLIINGVIVNYTLIEADGYSTFLTKQNLTDNDLVILNLTADLSFGTHLLIIDFSAVESSHRIESAVRIDEGLEPIIINQSDWMQFNAVVNKEVVWASIIDVTNPNDVEFNSLINASIPPGYSSIKLANNNNQLMINGLTAYWQDNLLSRETKRYIITLTTPPIIGGSQSLKIIDSVSDSVLVRNNLTFINLGLLEYSNASYDFNIKLENVVNVYCSGCEWSGFNDSLRLLFDNVEPGAVFNVLIDYWEKPLFFNVLLSSKYYKPNSSIPLLINLIPEESINGLNIEVEVRAPDGETVFADLISYDSVNFNELLSSSLSFSLINAREGNYSVNVRLLEGLRLIASCSDWFIVSTAGYQIIAWPIIIIAIIVIIFLVKRFKYK